MDDPTPPVILPKPNHLPLILGLGIFLIVLTVGTIVFLRRPNKPAHITLQYWGLWETPATFQPLIDEYEASHPNVTINYQQQSPNQYRERLQASLSQGIGPDIFRFHNTWVPHLSRFLGSVPPQAYSPQEFAATFYPVTTRELTNSGRLVGIPLQFDGLAMVVNEKLLTDSHKSIPQSWTELRQTAQAITRCEVVNGNCDGRLLVAGAAIGTSDNIDNWQDTLAILLLQNGVQLTNPSGQAAQDVLTFFTGFIKTDHVWDATLPSSTQAFIAGKVGIIFAPSSRVYDILIHTAGFKVGVYPLPQVPVDKNRGEQPITWASYWVEGVNRASVNSAIAWDFLKFLSSKDSELKFYKLASASRTFGAPPSRVDLSSDPSLHSALRPYLTQAPFAASWYLASDTSDGPQGINSQLSAVYAGALQRILSGSSSADALASIQIGTNQILSSYGLVQPFPTRN